MMLECAVDGHTRPTTERAYGAEEMLVERQQHLSERRWTAPKKKKKYPKAGNMGLYFLKKKNVYLAFQELHLYKIYGIFSPIGDAH